MERPDGITESAWEAAERVAKEATRDAMRDPLTPYYITVAPHIARAIQSAVEAERERAAGVTDGFADAQRAAWDAFKVSGKEGPATSLEAFFRVVAQAIRKGA